MNETHLKVMKCSKNTAKNYNFLEFKNKLRCFASAFLQNSTRISFFITFALFCIFKVKSNIFNKINQRILLNGNSFLEKAFYQ